MSIDYRLLDRFETSRRRHQVARELLPEHWRSDPRPEAKTVNEHWVRVIVRAWEHQEQLNGKTAGALLPSADDR